MSPALHVCWLVDDWKDNREPYVRAWQARGWQITLWHAGQLTRAPEGVELRDARPFMQQAPTARAWGYELAHRSHAAAADLFRFAVLHECGGSYVDLDVLPNKAREATQHPLFGQPQLAASAPSMFAAFHPPPPIHLEIRFVSSPARHPLLAAIVGEQARLESAFMDVGGYRNGIDKIVNRTGPVMATRVVRAWAREHGVPFGELTLPAATIDRTRENDGEHMTARYPEILAAARK